MTDVQGRRLVDAPFNEFPLAYHDLQPGDYWRALTRDWSRPIRSDEYPSTATAEQLAGNLTGAVWGMIDPLGSYCVLSIHTVRENDDGTITVAPGDGSSNSILNSGPKGDWHGYIDHGRWYSV